MLGYSIQIKIVAFNAYGYSQESEAGNGGIIVLVPDSVISLLNNPTITSDSVIGISWSDGPSNGGKAIIDYRIWYDQSIGNYVILAEHVTNKFYTTQVPLLKGKTYRFKIQAENSVGYS